MKYYGITIDPGVSTGVCLFSWGDTDPFEIVKVWQFNGGAAGIRAWLDLVQFRVEGKAMLFGKGVKIDALVVEKFTPRPHETFALTRLSVESLRGEGVLIGAWFEPFIEWREPSQQYFMGGGELPDKKKRSREFLKLHKLHTTGKVVGQKDADDAISATLHSIGWLRKKRHMPTLEALFPQQKEG